MAVLITGGSKGVGFAIAKRFAEPGRDILINYLRDEDSANAAVEALRALGARSHAIRRDVGSIEGARELMAIASEMVDRLDVIVHCAVRVLVGPLLEADPVALTQAIVVKLHRLYTGNMSFRLYRRALIEENKWRAARYGIEGKLIDFGKESEVPMRELATELLEFVDDVVDDLGSRSAVEYVNTILSEGTSAERQLRVYQETGDLKAVVRHLVEETRGGVIQPRASSAHAIN